MLDFGRFEALTFDCYGTLIDWESGLLPSLRAVLAAHGVAQMDRKILDLYARLEAEAERGTYQPYREVLRTVVRGFGREFGFTPSKVEQDSLPESVADWPPFPDTVEALRALGRRFRLAILSNTDDELFSTTARRLGVEFDAIITAQQVRAYKPDRRMFETALHRLNIAPNRLLHVGQSVYHDVVPAQALGLATALVTRRGHGATLPTQGAPDLTVPDLEALASLVEAG